MKPDNRPKQSTPAEMVDRLMALVRSQFCGDQAGDEWGKNSHFVRQKVILWPAHFVCNLKRFTMPAERYEQIMREIFLGIKQHGTGDPIRYWPGYLMKCVQEHWKIHWEDYYKESKATATIADAALLQLGKLPAATDRTVEALSAAHGVLARKARRRKSVARGFWNANLPGL